MPDITPAKKGKITDNLKGKEAMPPPEAKKRATWRFRTSPSKAINALTIITTIGESSSNNLEYVLGPRASILGSTFVAEKILGGVIPLANKEKIDKLTLNQVITKFFHVIGQVLI